MRWLRRSAGGRGPAPEPCRRSRAGRHSRWGADQADVVVRPTGAAPRPLSRLPTLVSSFDDEDTARLPCRCDRVAKRLIKDESAPPRRELASPAKGWISGHIAGRDVGANDVPTRGLRTPSAPPTIRPGRSGRSARCHRRDATSPMSLPWKLERARPAPRFAHPARCRTAQLFPRGFLCRWRLGVELGADGSVDIPVDLVGPDQVENAVLAQRGAHGGLHAGQSQRDA